MNLQSSVFTCYAVPLALSNAPFWNHPHYTLRGRPVNILTRINFNHRPSIRLLRPHQVIDSAEDRRRARHQNRPVHILGVDIRKGRPEAEEQDKSKVDAGKDVVRDAERVGHFPGAPGEVACSTGGQVDGRGARLFDAARAAVVEEHASDEEVRGKEAGDGDGDDAVEGCCGTDVD